MRIAPAAHYAAKNRATSARAVRDEQLKQQIMDVYEASGGVYGIRKIHGQLARQGTLVAWCTIERPCRLLGIRDVARGKFPRPTRPAPEAQRPADLVERVFEAEAPNPLRVADITYVQTLARWVYVAFVLDVFSRKIAGWRTSTRLYGDLAIDALVMALHSRENAGQDTSGLIHYSDHGVQYRSTRYTQRLESLWGCRHGGRWGGV